MDIQDLRVLCMIPELGSIKAVADSIYLTQPAISYRIRKLEDEFNVKILIRENKGVRFTPEGELLVEYARRTLDELDGVKEELGNFGNRVQGTLRLGVANNFAHYKLPEILKKFQTLHPKVRIKLHTGLSPEIMDLMILNKIDIGIENCGYTWSGEKRLLCKERIALISNRKMCVADIDKHPMIMTKRNHVLHQQINTWLRNNLKKLPAVMMEVDFIDTCKVMVRNGLGIAIVPAFCLEEKDGLNVLFLEDENGAEITRDIFVNYKKDRLRLSSVREFLKHIYALEAAL